MKLSFQKSLFCATEEALQETAAQFATSCSPGTVIGLVGEMGAGKTNFVKGFAKGLSVREQITSPTFSLAQEYLSGRLPLFHFDFYRLKSEEELFNLGWDDYFDQKGIIVAEWANRFPHLFDIDTHWLRLAKEAQGRRIELLASLPNGGP